MSVLSTTSLAKLSVSIPPGEAVHTPENRLKFLSSSMDTSQKTLMGYILYSFSRYHGGESGSQKIGRKRQVVGNDRLTYDVIIAQLVASKKICLQITSPAR